MTARVDFFQVPDGYEHPGDVQADVEALLPGTLTYQEHHLLQDVWSAAASRGVDVPAVGRARLSYADTAWLLSIVQQYQPERPAHASRRVAADKLEAVLSPAVEAGDGVYIITD